MPDSDPSAWPLRPLLAADLEALALLEARANPFPWNLRQLQDCLEAGYEGWVCWRPAGGPAGYALASVVLDEASLLNIAVHPDCRRMGIGRRLLRHLLEREREAPLRRWFLEVRASNRGAIGLYESLGFSRVALRRGYYRAAQGREDALVYSRESPSSSA